MSSTLVTHPMLLVAVIFLVTVTLLVLSSHGLLFDSFTPNAYPIFWEFVIAPVCALVAVPLALVIVGFAAIAVLPAVVLVATLVLIVANSPAFRLLGALVANCYSVLIENAAPLLVSTALAKTAAIESIAAHGCDSSGNDVQSAPTPELSSEPRQFKKRRPINYSGAKPPHTLDLLNDAEARMVMRIARIKSKTWNTAVSSELPVCSQDSATLAATTVNSATTTTPDKQETYLGTPYTAPTCPTPVTIEPEVMTESQVSESELTIAINDSCSSAFQPIPDRQVETLATQLMSPIPSTECHVSIDELTPATDIHNASANAQYNQTDDLKAPVVLTSSAISKPAIAAEVQGFEHKHTIAIDSCLLTPQKGADIYVELKTTKPEHTLLSTEPDTAAEPSTLATGAHNASPEFCLSDPASLILSANRQNSLSAHPVVGIAHPGVARSSVNLDTLFTTTSIMADKIIDTDPVDMVRALSPEQHADTITLHPALQVNNAHIGPAPSAAAPSFAELDSQPDQIHPPVLANSPPVHSIRDGLIPPEVLQAEKYFLAALASQNTSTETGQLFDGVVDVPPVSGMSAPTAIDQRSQLGYMRDMSGATFASEVGSVCAPNHSGSYGMSGSDMMQLDYDTPLPSDSELLALAAIALAGEAMDWAHTSCTWNAPERLPEYLPTPALNDHQPSELDSLLQLASVAALLAPVPQLPDQTLAFTYPNSETSTPLPTNDELLELAAAAMEEDMTGILLENHLPNKYNPNLGNGDMTPLDPCQVGTLDQATQSAIDSSGTSIFGLADFSSGHIDPNELARMWDELGVSLKDWAGQVPGAMDFSEEDIMRMLEFDPLDTTCSPSYVTLDNAAPPTPTPNPAPAALPARKIKKLPLRRFAIENRAQEMSPSF